MDRMPPNFLTWFYSRTSRLVVAVAVELLLLLLLLVYYHTTLEIVNKKAQLTLTNPRDAKACTLLTSSSGGKPLDIDVIDPSIRGR